MSSFNQLKKYGSRPEMISLWILAGLMVAVLIANVFFLPFYLSLLSFIIFFAVLFAVGVSVLHFMRVRAESEIKTREFKSVIEHLRDGIIVYDGDFKILVFNPAAETMFGLSAEDVMGKKITQSMAGEERYRKLAEVMFPSLAPSLVQISESDDPLIVEISLEESDETFRITTNRMYDADGNVTGFLKIITDRTREKNLLQSKNEFISVAAHQLRTPLTAINWALESMLGESAAETASGETQKIILEAKGLAERALKIINDLLNAVKLEEGKFGYEFQEINLAEAIREFVDQAEIIAKEYGITVTFRSSENYVPITADLEKLSLVFSNVLDNAIRYNTKNGRVDVSVEMLPDKPYAVVRVKDTGIGISEKELKKIFQKFYRTPGAIAVEQNGSGLGLYIARNIVRRHGGEITVESVEGRGTTVSITLPRDPNLVPKHEIVEE